MLNNKDEFACSRFQYCLKFAEFAPPLFCLFFDDQYFNSMKLYKNPMVC